jgi:hypothetical protein
VAFLLTGIRLDGTPVEVAEGKTGDVRITKKQAVHVNLRDDDGNEITSFPVSGNIGVSGTVDTELAPAILAADGIPNPTVPQILAHVMGFNGTTHDRITKTDANSKKALDAYLHNPTIEQTTGATHNDKSIASGGKDGAGNVRPHRTDTDGRSQIANYKGTFVDSQVSVPVGDNAQIPASPPFRALSINL